MSDEALLSPRRIVNAVRLWAWFVSMGECKLSLWWCVVCYRRPEASEMRAGGRL